MKFDFVHGSDAGLDDLCVQSIYLRSGKLPLAQVASFGCTSLHQATQNVCDVNGMFGRNIPVCRGLEDAFSCPDEGARPTFYGDNGLNDHTLPSGPGTTIREFPTAFTTCLNGSKFDWLETGPMTNLASLVQNVPMIVPKRLRHVYAMGGAFDVPGLVGAKDPHTQRPIAEFNWFHDPRAVCYLLAFLSKSGKKMRIIPWDECRKLRVLESRIKTLKGEDAIAQHLLDATRKFFALYGSDFTANRGNEDAHITCPDYVAYCAMLGEFGHFEERKITVDCTGKTFGKSRYSKTGFLVDVFSLDDPAAATESFIERMAWS